MYQIKGKIDSNNASELEKDIMSALPNEIDASKLEYISSAGLRVLLKLRKTVGDVTIINVSSDVYDILDITGFTSLLTVKKALREVDVTGKELIGKGGNGSVYRLDDDTIVKVYKPWMNLEAIQKEREYAKTAFVNGIPSVIAYDVVKVGDCLGVVFEMLKSDTLGHAMRDNPEKLMEYVHQYVSLAKTLHATHVPADSFERIQDVYRRRVNNLTKWCTEEEMALLSSIIDDIPEADTVTHNDLHPGNIMLQNGELVLIDMPEVTMGPPICDLVSVFRDMISAPQSSASIIEGTIGMPADLIMKVGNLFFMQYTGIQDPDELKKYYEKLGLLYAFNVVLMCGAGSENATKAAPMIMEHLLHGVVIPNEQAIRYLFKTM